MPSPHTLGIYTCILASTECAAQARFLSLDPSFSNFSLEIFFLGGTPTSRRLENGRIGNSVWVCVIIMNEVFWIKEPLWIVSQNLKSKSIWVVIWVWEGSEGRVDKYDIRIGRMRIHARGDDKSIMIAVLIARVLKRFDTTVWEMWVRCVRTRLEWGSGRSKKIIVRQGVGMSLEGFNRAWFGRRRKRWRWGRLDRRRRTRSSRHDRRLLGNRWWSG